MRVAFRPQELALILVGVGMAQAEPETLEALKLRLQIAGHGGGQGEAGRVSSARASGAGRCSPRCEEVPAAPGVRGGFHGGALPSGRGGLEGGATGAHSTGGRGPRELRRE